jgi:hypothetical protein
MKNELSLKSRQTANKTPLEILKILSAKKAAVIELIKTFDLKL